VARFSNELKITLTVLGAALVAFIGFRYIQDIPLFRQSNRIYATFHRVDGLNPGSYVYVNGVKVGSVKEVQLTQNDSVRIAMNIDLDNRIPKGSMAILKPMDLLGSKAVVIEKSDSNEYVKNGGELEGDYLEGMMSSLKEEGEKLGGDISNSFNHFNRLLERLNEVVDDTNRSELDQTLRNLRSSTHRIARLFEQKEQKINRSIDHAHGFLENLDTLSSEQRDEIKHTMDNLQRTSKELEYLTSDLRTTTDKLNTLLTKINEGEGSIGLMVNDPSLYHNLDTLSANLKDLSREFNEKPERFLQYMRLVEIF